MCKITFLKLSFFSMFVLTFFLFPSLALSDSKNVNVVYIAGQSDSENIYFVAANLNKDENGNYTVGKIDVYYDSVLVEYRSGPSNNSKRPIAELKYKFYNSDEGLGLFGIDDFKYVQIVGFYRKPHRGIGQTTTMRPIFLFKNGDRALVDTEEINVRDGVLNGGVTKGNIFSSAKNFYIIKKEKVFGGKIEKVTYSLLGDFSKIVLGYSATREGADELLKYFEDTKVSKSIKVGKNQKKSFTTPGGTVELSHSCYESYYWGPMGSLKNTKACLPDSIKFQVNEQSVDDFKKSEIGRSFKWVKDGYGLFYESNENIVGNYINIHLQ